MKKKINEKMRNEVNVNAVGSFFTCEKLSPTKLGSDGGITTDADVD